MKRKIIVEKQTDAYFVGIETTNEYGTAKHGMTLKEIGKEMLKVRNLSTIIEKKKEEFEKSNRCSCADLDDIEAVCPAHGLKAIRYKRFLEKAIRESVEEALREVRPGSAPNYYDATFVEVFGRAIEEYDSRVKEFMK